MAVVEQMQQRLESPVLSTARTTQALVITSFDRVTGIGFCGVQPMRWVLRRQQDLLASLAADPAQMIDRQYHLVARLLDLHREFAQRLFDITDPAEQSHVARDVQLAPVRRLGT